MEMIIIGAGIAGIVASNYFKNYRPQIYEEKDTINNHKAVMRLRDPSLGYLLDCKLGKINVKRNIYYDGKYYSEPNIRLSNMYSRKMLGIISNRSIDNIGEDGDRYIMEGSPIPITKVHTGHKLLAVSKGEAIFDKCKVGYDICISTIPMDEMLKLTMIEYKPEYFKHSRITIARCELGINADTYQTIYYPDYSTPVYRATLENDSLIIESLKSIETVDIEMVVDSFGIFKKEIITVSEYIQEYGKIYPIDNSHRKKLILELTINYNIYSLGRFATWRNITADKLINDLDLIREMINSNSSDLAYRNKLMEDDI